MNRTISTFLFLTALTAGLAALSMAVRQKGYAFGSLGIDRLDGLADAATFIPLAATYAVTGALMMVLPLRGAGWVHANGATPLFMGTLVLLAAIVGVQLARFSFGQADAIGALADWRFLFGPAIVAAHLAMDGLRRNALLRTLGFMAFVAACALCLFWTFRL